jgi:hypothetical protein
MWMRGGRVDALARAGPTRAVSAEGVVTDTYYEKAPLEDVKIGFAAYTYLGWLMILGSLVLFVIGLIYDPSVASSDLLSTDRIVNVGRMATKNTILSISYVGFIAGWIVVGFALVAGEVRRSIADLKA